MGSPRTSSGAALAILGASALVAATLMGGPYLWGRSVAGQVTEVERGHRGACSPIVEYEVDGRTYRHESLGRSRPCDWSVGETVEVHYLEDNPGDGRVFSAGTVPLVLLFALGAGLTLGGASRITSRGGPPPGDAGAVAAAVTPRRLADAPVGEEVAVTGALHVLTELRSPLGDELCGAWHVQVRRPVLGQAGELVCSASSMKAFELRDGDVTLEVPTGAPLRLDLTPGSTGAVRRQAAPRLAVFLRERGKDAIDADPTQNDYDWSEAVLREGEPVTVVTRLARVEPDGGAYRAGRRVLRAAPATGARIVVRRG